MLADYIKAIPGSKFNNAGFRVLPIACGSPAETREYRGAWKTDYSISDRLRHGRR